MTTILHPGELCKVRLGNDNGYRLAYFKNNVNSTSASIECVEEGGDQIVLLNNLWKIKKRQATLLKRRLQSQKKQKAKETVRPLFSGVVTLADEIKDGLKIVAEFKLANSPTIIRIAFDSLVKFNGCAIVNAANEGCLQGGGIDGLINRIGGPVLWAARQALPIIDMPNKVSNNIRCPTGDAKSTPAGNLPCRLVIHAVGPRFTLFEGADHTENLKVLEQAYKRSLHCAKQCNVKSIAFPIISAGFFRGSCSLREVIKTGIESIATNVYSGLDHVTFCGFTVEEQYEICQFVEEIKTQTH